MKLKQKLAETSREERRVTRGLLGTFARERLVLLRRSQTIGHHEEQQQQQQQQQ